MNRQGHLVIVAAPSGAGKTTLVKAITQTLDNIGVSISHTTRPQRPGEVDGKDYHFVTEAQFNQMVDQELFLEHATVYSYQYGTSHESVNEQLKTGMDVILEIDWQGARQIRDMFPDAVSIFILPPSEEALRERLMKRCQDDVSVIDRRMSKAKSEMRHFDEFNYLIINDDLDRALDEFTSIVKAQRLQRSSQEKRWSHLLADLLKNQ